MLEGSILQKLTTAHDPKQTELRPLSLGVYYKNTLIALCHALEDFILDCKSQPLVVTAFQRGKWYIQEADRYAEIADKAQQVVIMASPDAGFAEHPTGARPNVDLISLIPNDPVAAEWHLIIFGPTYAAMVLCQELSDSDYGPSGPPTEDLQRKFYGFWTFEANLVQEVVELAIAHLGQYNPSLQSQLTKQMQSILAIRETMPQEPLGEVVSKVVNYLEQQHEDLGVKPGDACLDDNLLSNELQAFLRMAQTIDLLAPENPRAPSEVSALAEMIGQLLDLPGWQLKRLRLAGLLHRLGPMQGTGSLFGPTKPMSTEYPSCPLTCSLEPGAQALRTMPRLRAVAQIMTHQTECWNGTGSPAGLAADDIPLESRILGLATYFQGLAGCLEEPKEPGQQEAWVKSLQKGLSACQQESGDRWDPKLVELLTLLVSGMCQGMSLAIQSPKFTNGLWLLDALPTEGDPLPKLFSELVEVGHGN
jgi:DICT domain-containing protein